MAAFQKENQTPRGTLSIDYETDFDWLYGKIEISPPFTVDKIKLQIFEDNLPKFGMVFGLISYSQLSVKFMLNTNEFVTLEEWMDSNVYQKKVIVKWGKPDEDEKEEIYKKPSPQKYNTSAKMKRDPPKTPILITDSPLLKPTNEENKVQKFPITKNTIIEDLVTKVYRNMQKSYEDDKKQETRSVAKTDKNEEISSQTFKKFLKFKPSDLDLRYFEYDGKLPSRVLKKTKCADHPDKYLFVDNMEGDTLINIDKNAYAFYDDIRIDIKQISSAQKYATCFRKETIKEVVSKVKKYLEKTMVYENLIEADTSDLVQAVLRACCLYLKSKYEFFSNIGFSREKNLGPSDKAVKPDVIIYDYYQKINLLIIEVKHGKIFTNQNNKKQHLNEMAASWGKGGKNKTTCGIITTFKKWIFTEIKPGKTKEFVMSAYRIKDTEFEDEDSFWSEIVKCIWAAIFRVYESAGLTPEFNLIKKK